MGMQAEALGLGLRLLLHAVAAVANKRRRHTGADHLGAKAAAIGAAHGDSPAIAVAVAARTRCGVVP